MDEAVDKDTQEKMFENVNKDGGKQAGNLSPDYIRKVVQELSKLKMSMGSLKDKIKKLMDKSASYFSAKKETIYEDLFNTDNLAGLSDYIELHPKLRKVFVEDILVKDEKSIGKIDIYIDISGSMSDSCGVEDINGRRITKLDFCKAFTVKLGEMELLNDVYLFNNSVNKFKNDPISLAMLDTSGGTSINKAVDCIEKVGINALVITDAEDHCGVYSDKAFFIGVNGANFRHFNNDVIRKYSENNQVVVFDGSRIQSVDKNGYTIN
jgi:predicted metal-dependent peptidase